MQLASMIDVASTQTQTQVNDIKVQQANDNTFSDFLEKETTKAQPKTKIEELEISKKNEVKIEKDETDVEKDEAEVEQNTLLDLVEELTMVQAMPQPIISDSVEVQAGTNQEKTAAIVAITGEITSNEENNTAQLASSLENDTINSTMPLFDSLKNENTSNDTGELLNQTLMETNDNVRGTIQEGQFAQETIVQSSSLQPINGENETSNNTQDTSEQLEYQKGELIESNKQTEESDKVSMSLEQRIQIVQEKNNSSNPFFTEAKTITEATSELNNVEMLMSMGQATQVEMNNSQVEFGSETMFGEATIDSTNIMEQVVEKFDFIQLQSSEMMKVQLKPDYLGEITISLERSNDGMTASILTSNAQVREALAGQIGQLTSTLSDYGIKPNHINVVFTEQGNYMGQENQGEAMPFNNQTTDSNQMSQWAIDSEQLEETEQDVLKSVTGQNELIRYGRINRYA